MAAAKLPYITSRKQEIDQEARISAASPDGKNKGKINVSDPDKLPVRTNYTMDAEGSEQYRKDLEAYSKRKQA